MICGNEKAIFVAARVQGSVNDDTLEVELQWLVGIPRGRLRGRMDGEEGGDKDKKLGVHGQGVRIDQRREKDCSRKLESSGDAEPSRSEADSMQGIRQLRLVRQEKGKEKTVGVGGTKDSCIALQYLPDGPRRQRQQ